MSGLPFKCCLRLSKRILSLRAWAFQLEDLFSFCHLHVLNFSADNLIQNPGFQAGRLCVRRCGPWWRHEPGCERGVLGSLLTLG